MREIVTSNANNAGLLFVGFVTAFISAYFVVKWLIGFLQKNSLTPFAWYRIVVGIILLGIFGI